MKILIYGDVHWSTYSSIVRSRGTKYSTRLENLIKSVNWAEKLADDNNCDEIICLGDFFDRPELTAEEISALDEVKWSNLPHFFLVGNHESNVSNLFYSSTKALKRVNFHIIDKPFTQSTEGANFLFLPYILEENRKPLLDYWNEDVKKETIYKRPYIFSHNDIKGINYGRFQSKEGFGIDEIENKNLKQCVYINGHIHNAETLKDGWCKVINLGNLTGQNFSEDAFKYEHHVAILNTKAQEDDPMDPLITFIENPYAFNFYKIQIDKEDDLKQLDKLKTSAVCTFNCNDKCLKALNDKLKVTSIIESRTIIFRDTLAVDTNAVVETISKVDHIKQFEDFTLKQLGDSDIVRDELMHVCGENK